MNRLFIAALIFLTACTESGTVRHVVDTVQVKVPVIERAEAPKELFREKIPAGQMPIWVAPTDPRASVCITQTGEPMLKSILRRDESLLDGWESYGAR